MVTLFLSLERFVTCPVAVVKPKLANHNNANNATSQSGLPKEHEHVASAQAREIREKSSVLDFSP